MIRKSTKPKALWHQIASKHQKQNKVLQNAAKRQRTAIRKRSPKRAAQERKYNARVKVWIKLPWNQWCACCQAVLEQCNEQLGGLIPVAEAQALRKELGITLVRPSTQCHHSRGKRGVLLLDERFWVPVDDQCHTWITNHTTLARALQLVGPVGSWNSSVKL